LHSERIELSKEARPGWLVDEGGAEGFSIAGLEILIGPVELTAEARVFLLEGDVGDGARVGADTEGDACSKKAFDGVGCVGGDSAGLHVAGGTDFEMDAFVGEMADESRVFDAADAVADAGRLEGLQGFPDA